MEPDGPTGSETLEDDDMLLDDEFSVLLEDISELDVLVVVVVGAVVVVVLVSELVCGSLAGGSLSVGALIYAGFSVRAVCLFTGIKYKLFYLKKSRLIKRILDSTAPHRELFREKIG